MLELLAACDTSVSQKPLTQCAGDQPQRLAGFRLGLWLFLGSGGIFRMFLHGQQPTGLVLLSRPRFSHQSAFTYVVSVRAAGGFAPLCAGAQQMVVVAKGGKHHPGLC